MWLNELSKRWLGWPPTGRPARPQATRRRGRRLTVEQLEDRNLLSVGPIDVIAHLPVAEYNQFTANAVNSEGNVTRLRSPEAPRFRASWVERLLSRLR